MYTTAPLTITQRSSSYIKAVWDADTFAALYITTWCLITNKRGTILASCTAITETPRRARRRGDEGEAQKSFGDRGARQRPTTTTTTIRVEAAAALLWGGGDHENTWPTQSGFSLSFENYVHTRARVQGLTVVFHRSQHVFPRPRTYI